ncbi:hypothetical protein GPJ56_007235 [Histomonas meleagridis]|nr:hypothetical protein GPJ56_007235 [Histomonas meleagridis]
MPATWVSAPWCHHLSAMRLPHAWVPPATSVPPGVHAPGCHAPGCSRLLHLGATCLGATPLSLPAITAWVPLPGSPRRLSASLHLPGSHLPWVAAHLSFATRWVSSPGLSLHSPPSLHTTLECSTSWVLTPRDPPHRARSHWAARLSSQPAAFPPSPRTAAAATTVRRHHLSAACAWLATTCDHPPGSSCLVLTLDHAGFSMPGVALPGCHLSATTGPHAPATPRHPESRTCLGATT